MLSRGAGFVIAGLLALLASFGPVRDADAAYTYSKSITIDRTKVGNAGAPATFSSFPMLYRVTDPDLRTTANGGHVTSASGFDIIFKDSIGTTLDHEIEKYVPTTGEFVAWVRVPTLNTQTSGSNTVITIYYGDSSVVTSQENATGVWDSNFKAVLHLKEDPAAAAPQMKDSTSNANHGTSAGSMTSGDQVAGKIAGSLDFDGSNDEIRLPNAVIGGNTAWTLTAWIKTGSSAKQTIYGEGSTTTTNYLYFDKDSGSFVEFYLENPPNYPIFNGSTSVIDNAWHLVTIVQRSTTDRELFVDGVSNGTNTQNSGTPSHNTASIGLLRTRDWTADAFLGGIDEVRISNAARSAHWLKTEYNNQNAPGDIGSPGFYTVGSESGGGAPISLSSAANQTFTAGQAAQTASTMTVTDGSTPTITAAQDLRIRIPATFNMVWDTSVTTVTLGGTASGKVSATPSYEPGDKVVVLNVTSDFAASQTLTIAGLKFTNFAAASAADNLELVVAGSGGATAATDDKTITINAAAAIGGSLVTSIADSSNLSSYSFPSATYSNNVLYIAFTATTCGSSSACSGTTGAPTVTSLSGAGLTFTEIGTAGGVAYDGSPGRRRIQAWHAFVTSGATTGVVTAALSGQADSMGAVILAFTGTKTTGVNGADAIANYATNGTDVDVTSLQVNMASFASSNNRPVAFFTHRANEATTNETGYTELWDGATSSLLMGHMAEWHATSAETTPSASWATLAQAGGFALELAADAGGGFQTTYRSIGVAADLVNSGTISITSGSTVVTKTSGLSWVTENRGQGDRLTVDGNSYVISSVDSANQLTLASPALTTYTGTTYTIARQFTTLQGWANCVERNTTAGSFPCSRTPASGPEYFASASSSLVADNRREIGVAYNDGAFTGMQLLTAATDATHDITLTVATGNRHTGVAGTGAVINNTTNTSAAIFVDVAATMKVEWFEVKGTATGSNGMEFSKSATLVITNNLIHDVPGEGIRITNNGASADVFNNVVYQTGSRGINFNNTALTGTMRFLNNTVYNAATESFRVNGMSTGTAIVRNNIALVCGTSCYSGTFSTSSNNISSDATGSAGLINLSATASTTTCSDPDGCVGFQALGATPNLHLATTSYTNKAVDSGTTLSSYLTTDIDDESRPIGAAWDIGADEGGAGGASPGTLSSAASQTFAVGQAAALASTLTVTDSSTPTITAAQDIRIRIPAALSMIWDTSVTTVTLGGGAAGKVSATGVTYEDSNRTAVINVTTDFAASDQVTIANLKFASFTAASSADSLQLVVSGSGGGTAATDDKTKTIVASATLSSTASQIFTVGQASTTASTLTVTDSASASITAAQDIRIRIPATFNMIWDTSVTTVTLGGGAAGKVSASGVTYEESNRTAVINVTTNFAASDQVTIAGLKFTNFSAASAADNLELVVAGSGGATAGADDKSISITAASGSNPIVSASSTAAATTTSSTDVVMDGMTVTPGAGDYLVAFSTTVGSSSVGTIYASIYVNGVKQAHTERQQYQEGSIVGSYEPMMTYGHVTVGAGQTVDIRWRRTAGTATAQARTLNLYPVAASDVTQVTATADATTSSASFTLLSGMTISPAAGTYLALFSTSTESTATDTIIDTSLFVGGTQLAHTQRSFTEEPSIPDTPFVQAILAKVTVTAGQAVEVQWRNSGTAGSVTAHQRTLTLYKVDPANIAEATATTDTTSSATSYGLLNSMTLTPGAGTYLALFSSSFYYGSQGSSPVTYHSLYVNGAQLAETERQPTHESSLDYTNIPVATNGVVSPGAGQAVEVRWRSSATDTRTAHQRTLVLLKQAAATTKLSSAANQTFTVGQAAALASTMTVTDGSTPTVTAAQDLRIRIPAGLNMTFDPAVTTVALGGTAAGKVSTTPTYESGNKVAVLNVTSNFTAGQTLTIDGLKFGSFSAASAASSLELVVAGSGGATEATDDKTKTIVAPATLSSASNQTFTVGQASTTAATITVTDSSVATITSSQEIRIRIPAALNMTWDTSVTTITRGGTASGKVSATLLAYEDSNKTAVINVTTNFANSDTLTIDGLKFTNFSAASAANSLQLVVSGSGGATAATDDKTITIIALASLSSAAHQFFTVGQASTTAATMTVTDGSTPTITAAQDLRIRIPAGFNMTFDPTITTVTLGGTASGKMSATLLAYEDSNRTAVLNVTTNFATGDQLTIAGLKFTNFTAASAASNLQLVVAGSGGATAATDDKLITIAVPGTLSLYSAANQVFTVGQGATAALMMTVTDGSTPAINATQDIRIQIPAGLNMTFDPTVTTATLGGTAAGKVSTTPTYESGNKVVVLDVTTSFGSNDELTIAGLKFTNFSAVSAADSLELVITGSGGATATTDDKTITIIAIASLSSAAHQSFSVGQASTAAATITVTDSSTPIITAAQDIRIRIPPALSMTWDTSVTSVTLGGTASGKVNSTGLTYEDSNKTVRLNVTSDFSSGQTLTIAGLKFTNFTAVSAQHLQLVVSGSGGATAAIDDKTITITGAAGGGAVTPEQTIDACVDSATPGVVAVDSTSTNTGTGSTVDVTHTVSGSDRLMLVGISTLNDSTVSSVVWDPSGANQSASLVTGCNRLSANGEMWMYQLVAPATGTHTLRVTFTTSESAVVGVTSFTGVDQTTPLGTCVVANGDPGPASVTVSSAAGELVFDTVASDENVTAYAGQTVLWDVTTPANGGASTKPGAASVTMQWSAGSTGWAIGAVPIKPAGASFTSLTLPSWTPQANELMLVGVVMRKTNSSAPTVSGNGVTWTEVADFVNTLRSVSGSPSHRIALFRASGASPTAGAITVSAPGNDLPVYAAAVRLSGVDTAVNQGIEAVNSTEAGTTDNANMKVSVTTATANAMALAWGGQRNSRVLTLPAEETLLIETGPTSSSTCGTSGDRIRGHMWEETVATPAATDLGQDNDLDGVAPWSVIGVSIKPLGVGGAGPQAPGRFNAFESTTVAGATTGVLRTKQAGNTVSVDIAALESGRTTVDTTFAGTVKVEVLDASNNTAALDGDGCRSTWSVIQTLSNPTFSAGDNGRKTISFTVPNAYPDVRLRISYPTSSPTLVGCSSDNFAIRPSTLANFAVSDSDWETAGTSRALTSTTFSTVTHKAGRPMSVRATAVNATGTTAASNYAGTPTAWTSACGGAACPGGFGTLTLGSAFTAGQLATDVASYNDVGSFALQLVDSSYASVDAYDTVGDCTASGSYVCSATINVGRFVPDHFAVSLNTPAFTAACGSFTYLGQTFSYATAPEITVTAQGYANNTTTRYAGNWWRITNASLTGRAYTTASGGLDTSGAPGTDPAISATGSGAGKLTFSSGTGFRFSRTTPVAPFDAEISLEINVIDADGVSFASNPTRFGLPSAGSGIAFNSGKPMRFGRLAIRNANGSQLLPLVVGVEAQYWSGSAFITNTLDSCSTIASTDYAMSNYTDNLSGSPTCETALSGGGTLSAGRGTLIFAAPGAGNDGSVTLTANLGASASGSTCTTQGAAPISATTANLPHLQGNWSGGGYDTNPSGRTSFGVYKGSEEVIYIRENF